LCVARAKAGEPAGLAIQALRQTAGRGSRGRSWTAPVGNLNFSVLLRPETPAASAGLFSLLAGVATAQAIKNLRPTLTPTLKWPNDILLDGAKLAGVLIDAATSGPHVDWLVIGIGINLAVAPEIPGRTTTSLAAHAITPHEAADALLASLSRWHDASAETILETWVRHGPPVGTPLTVTTPPCTGRFAGLSPIGELLLDTDAGTKIISTGEVMLGRGEEDAAGH
jgi:BirA family biotin operon repressor/biotin-[acetyl-CoA-carboxylase] ligase